MDISQVWLYPVKSMAGQRVDTAEAGAMGLAGDRAWATRDEVRGGIRGAKKIAGLMRLAAAWDDGPGSRVTITLPDGSTTTTDAPDRDAVLSAALGHEVTLWPLRPADDLDHYRRGAPDSDDLLEELRSIFGRDPDEPLPDLSVFPPEIVEFESPPGTYVDAFPLLVMSTSALRSLAEALPDSAVDVRRFRPNVVLDTGHAPGHPEKGWVGRTLRVGEVELEVVAPCPRCVMVTREVDASLPADRAVLRHVVRDLGQEVGVYATVSRPGRIAVGDPVEVR
jgi:uncharacterized protein YcbX